MRLLLIASLLMPTICFAGQDVMDQLGDILTGHKDNVEVHPYIAYTTKETLKVRGIPVIPKNLRAKYSPVKLGEDDNTRLHKLELGYEF